MGDLTGPGDILFTEDTGGAGHNWKMIGDQPWCRLYTILDPKPSFPFGQPCWLGCGTTTSTTGADR